MSKLRFLNLSKKRIIIVLILSLFFALACVLGYMTEKAGHIYYSLPTLIAFILTFIGSAICIFLLFSLFDRGASDKRKMRIPFFVAFGIAGAALLFFYFLWFLALYPGLFVFDAAWQLDMFRTNTISEHHPVLHTVLMGTIIEKFKSDDWHINRGIAAYTIIQIVISAACFSYMLAFVYKKTKSILVFVLTTLFLGVCPAIVLQVMSVTKDSLFFVFLILGIVLSIEMVSETEDFYDNPVRPILWSASILLSVIFRNNCIYALPFLILFLVITVKRFKHSVILLSVCTIVLFIFYKLIFVNAFVTEKVDGREMFSVPAQQIAAIYNSKDAAISADEKRIVENLIEKEALDSYVPAMADNVKTGLDMNYFNENRSEVIKTYLNLIKNNPLIASESFLANGCGFWYPGCELTLFNDGRKGYWVVGEYPPAVMNSKIPVLLKYFELFNNSDLVMRTPVVSLLFAPGTFFWIFALFFAYAIERKRIDHIPVFVFILALWLTYLLGPLAMVRYAIYLYGIVPLYPTLVMSKETED